MVIIRRSYPNPRRKRVIKRKKTKEKIRSSKRRKMTRSKRRRRMIRKEKTPMVDFCCYKLKQVFSSLKKLV